MNYQLKIKEEFGLDLEHSDIYWLLKKNIYIDQYSLFFECIFKRDFKTLDYLLKMGLDINCSNPKNYDATLLTDADLCLDDKTFELLLEKGANPDKMGYGGDTPLVFYLTDYDKKDYNKIMSLINHGADVNKETESGETPLCTAILDCHKEKNIVKTLIRKKCQFEQKRKF